MADIQKAINSEDYKEGAAVIVNPIAKTNKSVRGRVPADEWQNQIDRIEDKFKNNDEYQT